MDRYLMVNYQNKTIRLHIEQIKKMHSGFVLKMNRRFFEQQEPKITKSVEEMTELLFREPEYIISWLEKKFIWYDLKENFNINHWDYQEWCSADKKVCPD